MGVDPRYISQWLRMQWTADAARMLFSGKSATGADQQSQMTDFAGILNTLLSDAANTSASPESLDNREEGESQLLAGLGYAMLRAPLGQAVHNEDRTLGSKLLPGDLDDIVSKASGIYGVNPSLIKAVIQAESNFRPDAQSKAGAKGLMQLMDGTADMLGVDDPFDPEQNVRGGTRFLSSLLHKYDGHVGIALAAYNAGPGTIDKLGIRTGEDLERHFQSLPEETQKYVGKVIGFLAAH